MTDTISTLIQTPPAPRPVLIQTADGRYFVEEPGGAMRAVQYDELNDLVYSYR